MTHYDEVDWCSRCLVHVFAFFDGELAEPTCDEIREHLMACEECQDIYHAEVVVRELLKSACCCSAPIELRARITTLRIEICD